MELISIEELQENNQEIGDDGEAVRQIESDIDFEYALKRLTKRQRQIVKLKIEGYNLIEIADILQVKPKYIYNQMSEIKKVVKLTHKDI